MDVPTPILMKMVPLVLARIPIANRDMHYGHIWTALFPVQPRRLSIRHLGKSVYQLSTDIMYARDSTKYKYTWIEAIFRALMNRVPEEEASSYYCLDGCWYRMCTTVESFNAGSRKKWSQDKRLCVSNLHSMIWQMKQTTLSVTMNAFW
ncbi:hypothetical protein ACFE04_019981 [Oxalis oulophora]